LNGLDPCRFEGFFRRYGSFLAKNGLTFLKTGSIYIFFPPFFFFFGSAPKVRQKKVKKSEKRANFFALRKKLRERPFSVFVEKSVS
jgi:hypothetical protein